MWHIECIYIIEMDCGFPEEKGTSEYQILFASVICYYNFSEFMSHKFEFSVL